MDNNLITPWVFRDGREYMVSINVNDNPKSISIVVSDKITAEEWSCHYDFRYIEELTKRTGNYKPFDTFISMIKTALLKNTQAVTIDLFNYDDLKALKSRRHRQGFDGKAIFGINSLLGQILRPSGAEGEDYKLRSSGESDLSAKKYIIVTYVAEFDNVHYPLPLTYSGPPDPIAMQKIIRSLQGEISLLKNSNSELRQRVEITSNEEAKATGIFSKSASSTSPLRHGILRNANIPKTLQDFSHSYHSEMDQMQKVLASVHRLEEKVVSERSEHLKQMGRLQIENNNLRDKINELQITEQALNRQITRLEEIVASRNLGFQADNNNSTFGRVKSSCSSHNSFTRNERRKSSSHIDINNNSYLTMHRQQRNGKSYTEQFKESNNKCGRLKWGGIISTDDSKGKQRNAYNSDSSSCDPFGTKEMKIFKKDLKQTNTRSRTVSPAIPKFDPTAYVLQKKSKQEELAKIRMAKIESKWKEVRSRSRSRSLFGDKEKMQTPNRSRQSISLDRVSNNSLTDSRAPASGFCRRRLTSQSPPRNVEERLKERKKIVQERGRSLQRRAKRLSSPVLLKPSKQVNSDKLKVNFAKTKTGQEGKMRAKGNGIRQQLIRLKDVESSLHLLQALINNNEFGKMD